VRRRWYAFPLLTLAKDLTVGALWIVPWFDRRVAWRGNRFVLGPRSLLLRENPAPALRSAAPAVARAEAAARDALPSMAG
jgi:hypothetical protein